MGEAVQRLSLTRSQLALWDAQAASPLCPINIAQYLNIRGPVEHLLIRRFGQEMGRISGGLFSTFERHSGGIVQVIDSQLSDDVEIVDLRGRPDAFDLATQIMHDDVTTVIDPLRDRLAAAKILIIDDDRTLIYQRCHHLVLDGTATLRMLNDYARAYTSTVDTGSPVYPPRPDYAAPVESDAEYRASTRFGRDRDHWIAELEGLSAGTRLSSRGGVPAPLPIKDGGELPASTKSLLRTAETTLSTTTPALIAAVVGIYLARLRNQADVCLALPVAARTTAALRKAYGVVANIAPLRTRIHPGMSVRDALASTQASLLGALRHQRYRYEDIRADFAGTDNAMAQPGMIGPLLNFMLLAEPIHLGKASATLNVLTSSPVEDVVVNVYRAGDPAIPDELRLELLANPNSYTPDDVVAHHARLLSMLDVVLHALLHSPDTRIHDLPLLTMQEQAQLDSLDESNEIGNGATLPEILAADARDSLRDAPAVSGSGVVWTYGELIATSRRVAGSLVETGIGPGDTVAVATGRGPLQVLAFWAVAQTGAVVILVDPQHPRARVTGMLRDVEPAGVVVSDATSAQFADYPVINLSRTVVDAGAGEDVDLPLPHPSQSAYLVYTSGSTGAPKGVQITHHGIANLVAAQSALIGTGTASRVAAIASPAFDAAIFDMTFAAAGGACLVTIPDAVTGQALADFFVRERITHAVLTPSVLATIRAADVAAGALRTVMVVGESAPPDLLAEWSAGCEVFNLYGPAEATIMATATEALNADSATVAGIGSPIAGMRCHVLDTRLQHVPPGVDGELYLTGPGLAQGYRKQPGLTATRFVAAPWAPGERMYRTGDSVRWAYDGNNLQYVGRADAQLQIHGVRVEPAEIDAAAAAHPQVIRSVTVGARVGSPALYMYVTTSATHREEFAQNLRRHLAEVLPTPMIPKRIVVIDEFPLSRNGKLDLQALPDPAEAPAPPYRAPITETEVMVAEIVGEALGIERPSMADDFILIGGSSLIATQVATSLSRRSGRDVGIRTVLLEPTLGKLASAIESAPRQQAPLVAPTHDPERHRLAATPQQRQLWAHWQLNPDDIGFNLAAVVEITGVAPETAQQVYWTMVERHDALRTTFPVDAGGVRQSVRPSSAVADLRWVTDTDPSTMLAELNRPFDLTVDLPWRAAVVTEGHRTYAVLVANHIVMDGTSAQVLQAEAQALLAGGVLPARTFTYGDFTAWQADALALGRAELHDFWRRIFDSPIERLRLPGVDITAASGSPERVARLLDSDSQQRLASLVAGQHSSMFLAAHTSLAAVLARMSSTSDITIGTAVAGREVAEFSNVVGMVARTILLRNHIDITADFRTLLDSVSRSDLLAIEHSLLPVDEVLAIAEQSSGHRPGSTVPVFLAELDTGTIDEHEANSSLRPRFGLDFAVRRVDDTVELSMLFDSGMVASDDAGHLVDQWVTLLGAAVAEPDVSVVDHLVSAPEHRAEVSAAELLPDILARSVVSAADRVAVSGGTQRLSYRDLDDESSALARVLIGAGAGPGTVVAVWVERSVSSVVALCAIAKSGAAFVYLDPRDPPARHEHIVSESGADIGLHAGATPVAGVVWLDIRDAGHGYARDRITQAERTRPLHVDDAAYVVFTSGTTGMPKGVVVTHRGLTPLIADVAERTVMNAASTVLHNYSPAFDAHLIELLPALSVGATVVVCPPEVIGGPELENVIHSAAISHFFSTPSVLDTLEPGHVPTVRIVAVGGEHLPAPLARRWSGPEVALHNLYGPTETTVAVSGQHVTPHRGPVSIGTTIADMTLYVLDDRLRPVPANTLGELYIAGPGLARGYSRASLTAERFVPDPFGPPGSRLYRSGDLVHRRLDGALVVHGRDDGQVKVHGVRIELGEVTRALERIDGVRQAFTASQTTASGRVLTSWVVSDSLDGIELRRTLRQWLPASHLPRDIVVVPSFPLTANGKIDVAGLPSAVSVAPVVADSEISDAAELVRTAMASVLGVEKLEIGAHSNFFDHGGTSLSATMVTAALAQSTGTLIPVRLLLDHPTPAGFAEALATAGSLTVELEPTVLLSESTSVEQPLWCVHSITGVAWNFRALGTVLDRAIVGLQMPGLSDAAAPTPTTISEFAAVHVEQIRARQPHGPYSLIGWSLGGLLAHEIACQLTELDETVESLTLLDTRFPDEMSTVSDDGFSLDEGLATTLRLIDSARFDDAVARSLALVAAAQSHQPGKARVGTLLYLAGRGNTSAEQWRAHSDGRLLVYQVEAPHSTLGEPEQLAAAGTIIKQLAAATTDKGEQ